MVYSYWNKNLLWFYFPGFNGSKLNIFKITSIFDNSCDSVTVLNNFYLTRVSETPLPAPHLECSVEKRISADVPGPMSKTELSR